MPRWWWACSVLSHAMLPFFFPSHLCVPGLGGLWPAGVGLKPSWAAGGHLPTLSSLLPGHFPSQLHEGKCSQRPVTKGHCGFCLRHRPAPCYQLGWRLPGEGTGPVTSCSSCQLWAWGGLLGCLEAEVLAPGWSCSRRFGSCLLPISVQGQDPPFWASCGHIGGRELMPG